jgi:hypothetical protein
MCGATDVPLEAHHVRPMIDGGGELPPLNELLVVCRSCHNDWTWNL